MIAVVENGKVAETGTHDELMTRQGKYSALVEAQKGKVMRSTSSVSVAMNESATFEHSAVSRSISEMERSGLEDTPDMESGTNSVINIHNVHFTYPSRPENKIFRGLGFTVNEGETVAIVGPSGQGKSTIIQMIEEFYHPDKGRLEYHGDDIKKLNVRWFRNE